MDISRLCADRLFRLCGYTGAKARVSIIMNLIILSFFPKYLLNLVQKLPQDDLFS